jgi:hypothetical protein
MLETIVVYWDFLFMKKLTLKEIAITIVVSYLVASYVQGSVNPFNWGEESRFAQIGLVGISLLIQAMLKNT